MAWRSQIRDASRASSRHQPVLSVIVASAAVALWTCWPLPDGSLCRTAASNFALFASSSGAGRPLAGTSAGDPARLRGSSRLARRVFDADAWEEFYRRREEANGVEKQADLVAGLSLLGKTCKDLFEELLRESLTVAYETSPTSGGSFRSTAQVVFGGIRHEYTIEGLRESEIEEASLEAARQAVRGHPSEPARGPAAGATAALKSEADAAAVRQWGVFTYMWSPITSGLVVDFVAEPTPVGPDGGEEQLFTLTARAKALKIGSQVLQGAFASTEEQAEQSAASVLYSELERTLKKDRQDVEEPVYSLYKEKLQTLLHKTAMESIGGSSYRSQVAEVPVGGFVAVMQARAEYNTRKPRGRDEIPLRGMVRRSRQEASLDAMDTIYGVILQPAWKFRSKLRGPRDGVELKREPFGDDLVRDARWRMERLTQYNTEDMIESSVDPKTAASSLDLWFGGVCLCCLAVVSRHSWEMHVRGERHKRSFIAQPLQLKSELKRPPTYPLVRRGMDQDFLSVAGWCERVEGDVIPKQGTQERRAKGQKTGQPAILVLGEVDFSFSLALARLRDPGEPLLATSFLSEYNPMKPEVLPLPLDRRSQMAYKRTMLPSMDGVLEENLAELQARGVKVAYDVDAAYLEGTLPKVKHRFKYVIFPFPRVSVSSNTSPKNSELLQDFFLSAAPGGDLVLTGGVLQVVLEQGDYEEWDVNGIAASAGLVLKSRTPMQEDFYTPREETGLHMYDDQLYGRAGRKPKKAELLSFIGANSMDIWEEDALYEDIKRAKAVRFRSMAAEEEVDVVWEGPVPVIKKQRYKPKWQREETPRENRRRKDKRKTVDTFKPAGR